MRRRALALASVAAAAAASQGAAPAVARVDLYLSTTGDDGNDGSSAAKALKTPHGAQAAVRKALAAGTKTPVTVHIGHGEYALTEPLALTLADSGSPGATVTWQAADATEQGSSPPVAPVTFSAGQRITFSSAGKLWKADVSGLPAAAVAHGRQLYVNGRRAARSAEPGSWQCETTPTSPCTKSKTVWGDAAWQISNTSIHIVDPTAAAKAQSWPNSGAGVEFVWSGVGGAAWAESRCQVESVASAPFSQQQVGVEVKMSQPCLSCWASFKSQWQHHKVAAPTAIEAVGKPAQPGDWWLDKESKVVWYAPLPGESLGSAEAVMPVLETLLTGSGSGKTKLSDITFRGM